MELKQPQIWENEIMPLRVQQVTPFLAMEVLEQAQRMEKNGHNVIHLELGEPAGETPFAIKEAAVEAIRNNDTGYTHSMGKLELREEIARYYNRVYGVTVYPEQVVVTSGSSPAMLLAFSALFDNGDQVVMSDPYYACYPNFIRYLCADPLMVPVLEEEGFKLKASEIKKRLNPRVKGILINSPANPTGTVLNGEDLKELAALGPYIIADEVYHGINYTGHDHSILEYTDRAIVINGFSKRNIMTGWRLGYLIAPPALIRNMQKLQQNLFICACAFIQAAGIAALKEDRQVLEERFASYNERRLYLYNALQKMGIAPMFPPEGAFYMLANVKKYTNDSYTFAFKILEEAKVAVTPGIDFGPGAEGYIRISYACSMENLVEGLSRLEKFFMLFEDHLAR
ncbi:MAG TPA: pyridoxal phosphate-dependent aminotransferase [Candidatus Limnocylindrales bacterium]|nr:pyridoxal phosphate-dependent aminotransferase [Candidatus Limnocylindrales bacterium]